MYKEVENEGPACVRTCAKLHLDQIHLVPTAAAASSPAARRRTSGRRSAGYPPLRRPAAGSRAAGSQIGRARDTKGLYPLSDAVLVDEGVGRLLAWGER